MCFRLHRVRILLATLIIHVVSYPTDLRLKLIGTPITARISLMYGSVD